MMRFSIYSICFFFLVSCGGTCEDNIEKNYVPENGSFVIYNIYGDVRVHSHVMEDNKKQRILYNEGFFIVQPEVGDSIYKQKGVFEYVLIKKDSTYVESWSCSRQEPFIIDSWKNGEKEYIRSSNTQPDPFWDSSSSKIIKSNPPYGVTMVK